MKVPGRLTTSIERTACPPWGLDGGEPAGTATLAPGTNPIEIVATDVRSRHREPDEEDRLVIQTVRTF